MEAKYGKKGSGSNAIINGEVLEGNHQYDGNKADKRESEQHYDLRIMMMNSI